MRQGMKHLSGTSKLLLLTNFSKCLTVPNRITVPLNDHTSRPNPVCPRPERTTRVRLTVKVFHCLMYRLLFHKPMRHLVWSISFSKCLTVPNRITVPLKRSH